MERLAIFLVFACSLICAEPQRKDSPPASRPTWLSNEPLIIVGTWDDMPIFRRRVGGNPVWQEDNYLREHSEEAVKKLKDMGVTMAIIHFYKGFGLAAEKEHLDDARRLAFLCKKYGIRVGVYVGSTIGYESFLLEKPEAEGWFAPDYMGRPAFYPDQTFRRRVYFLHPGYRDYIKSVLRVAVEDLKADLIHFDNTSMQAQAPAFFHPLALEHFKDFLQNKYSSEMLLKRLGFSESRYVRPPHFDGARSAIDDPLFQEWTDFRCQELSDYYDEMARYIRALNPEVAVECNPSAGWSGRNVAWMQGVDYPRLLAHTDIVWTEEGNEAGVTEDGILVSKIRTYKAASTLKNKIFTYTYGSKLQMAEAMAYNRQCLGMVGGGLAADELPEGQKKYIEFYRRNFEHYRDANNVADVAVLQSFTTMAFNNDRPYQSSALIEQALIQARIPFDIIFDENLKDLSKYRVLVLPDQECLGDEKLELIRNFVRQGGGLVGTEHTSLYTEWRQRRRDFGLRDLFKLSAPPFAFSEEGKTEKVLKVGAIQNEVGRGRVVYLGEIKPATEKPPTVAMESKYWKLPVNWEEFVESVRWAAKQELSMDVKAPLTVTAELMEQKKQEKLIVHLINYDVGRYPIVRSLEVDLRIPNGRAVDRITVLSPDQVNPQFRNFQALNGRIVFTVPKLQTYALVVVGLR